MSGPDNRYGYLGLKDGRSYVIPVSGIQTARALDVYSAHSFKAQAGKRLLAFALRLGAGPYVLPRAEIANGTESAGLLDHLRQVLGQPALSFSISLGLPGPHRKPVLQAMTPNGVPAAFIKVGWNAASNKLVQQEADTLQVLHQINLPAFIMPAVLHAGEWHGQFLCVQSAPEQSASPPLTFGPVHRDILRAMATHAATEQALESSPFWQALRARAARVSHRYYRSLLDDGMAQISTQVGSRAIPSHFCHGDFTPWNSRCVGATLWLYDWEYASTEQPAGWDILRFFVQTQHFLEKRSPGDINSSLQTNGCAGHALKDHLQYLGADSRLSDSLVVLYLLDQIAFYAAENPAETRTLRFLATLFNLFRLRTEIRPL